MDEVKPINVLVSLHRGYGLGDAVQMSAVMRHVARHRQNWRVDFQAEEGRHVVGRGIVANTFAYGSPYPTPHYDAEVEICLYDTWHGYTDRPNTRVSSCLHERFGLPWDAGCGQYLVNVSRDAFYAAREYMIGIEAGRPNLHHVPGVVAIHSQGDSAKDKKDLTNTQTGEIGRHVVELGRIPLLLGRHNYWGSDADMNCAVINRCAAFVGIDSGPAKCASATDTPALVVWTGHHPAPYHDPAPNTTHLVPVGYHRMEPVCNDPGVVAWFDAHYNVRQYDGDPVGEIKKWLTEVLR